MRLTNPWPSNFRSNWNLEMLIFVEGGKPENPEKNPRSKDENQQQTQPTYDTGSGNRTRATLVGGERDHHCAIFAPFLIHNKVYTEIKIEETAIFVLSDVLSSCVRSCLLDLTLNRFSVKYCSYLLSAYT